MTVKVVGPGSELTIIEAEKFMAPDTKFHYWSFWPEDGGVIFLAESEVLGVHATDLPEGGD